MKFIQVEVKNKEDGLRQFQRRGFIVVDASYIPVNDLKGKARDDRIMEEYPALLEDLERLIPNKNVPLILVKVSVCRLLAQQLANEGFHVANQGTEIPFPGSGRQGEFQKAAAAVGNRLGLR